MSRHEATLGEEHPRNHQAQTLLLVIMATTWILDSFVFKFSTPSGSSAAVLVTRITVAAILLALGALLTQRSMRDVFDGEASRRVIDTDVYGIVRHPMYLGTLLIYLALFVATLSLLTLVVWAGGFVLYDRLASFEERNLTELVGEEYAAYRCRVPKWAPRPRRF